MAPTFDYDLTAQLNDGSEVKLNPEVHGWAEPERLSKVRVWSIVPRASQLPMVVVQIPEGAKPVFKSRVYGRGLPGQPDSPLPSFRCYAIGWHDTTSHWTWVLPDGLIEVGEEPIYADLILRKMGEHYVAVKAAREAQEEADRLAAESNSIDS